MSDITIVIASLSEAQGKELLDLASTWTAAGILRDSIWIDRAAWDGSTSAVGTVLSGQGNRGVAVQAELARFIDPENLRVASVHLAADDKTAAKMPSGDSEWAIHEFFRQRASGAQISFRSGVVVAIPPKVTVPKTVFNAKFSFNIFLTPEDRLSDGSLPRDVTPNELAGHALVSLVTLLGLPRWATDTPVDRLSHRQGNDPAVRVARGFMRIVDGGSLADDLVDSVLTLGDPETGWPLPAGLSPDPVAEPENSGTLAAVASAFQLAFDLRFIPFQGSGPPRPVHLGLWDGLKLFFRSFVIIISGAPARFFRYAGERVDTAIEDWFQRHTFGKDAPVVLTLRGRTRGEGNPASAAYQAVHDLGMPGTDAVVPEPRVWESLRAVATGLMDGSPFPGEIQAPMVGTARKVITRPSDIAPQSGEEFVFVSGDLRVEPSDPLGARVALRELGALPEPSEEDDDENEAENHGTPQQSDERESFIQWLDQDGRRESLTWKIGESLDTALQAAAIELANSLEAASKGEPSSAESEEEKANSRAFRKYLLSRTGVMLLLNFFVWLAVRETWDLRDGVLGTLLVTSVWQFFVLRKFLKYVERQTRLQYARAQAISRYYESLNRAHKAAMGVTRFSVLYWQYLDWAATLGSVLHRPWGRTPEMTEVELLGQLDRPLAFGIAHGVLDDDHFQRRVAGGQQAIATVGWLRTALDETIGMSLEHHGRLTNRDPEEEVDPFVDVSPYGATVGVHAKSGERILSERGQIRTDATHDRFAPRLRSVQAQRITQALVREPLPEVFHEVHVLAHGEMEPGVADPRAFLLQIAPTGTRRGSLFPLDLFTDTGRAHEPQHLFLSVPPSADVDTSLADVSRNQSQAQAGQRFIFGAHRLDITDDYELSALSVLCDSAESGAKPISSRAPIKD